MKPTVVITGIGLVSPLGNTPDQAFAAAIAGRSAITRWEHGDMPAAAVARTEFAAEQWFDKIQLTGMDRVSQLAVVAAEHAARDAGITTHDENAGIYVGTGMGGASAIDEAFELQAQGRRVPPLTVPAYMANAPAAHIAMRNRIHGPVLTYSVACSSSSIAIAEGARAVASGDIPYALVGGSEALLVPSVVKAWQALRTLAAPGEVPAAACRPFSRSRSGLVLGEGAAFLILESLDRAQARGAHIYAELAGAGISCDASHLTKPDASGQVRAITAALRNSGLAPKDVGYCNAHGTATQAGDIVECEALARVWGGDLDLLAVSSTKAMHGHLLGAAGALEAVITAMAVHHGQLPPNLHCEDQDPACAVTLVGESAREVPQLHAAISNSFAFGGTNVTLAFRRYAS